MFRHSYVYTILGSFGPFEGSFLLPIEGIDVHRRGKDGHYFNV